MKILKIGSLFLLTLIIAASCEKDESYINTEQVVEEVSQKELPPYREFECGEQTNPPSPYPCPNANCDYMGWDCLWEHVVYDPPHGDGISYNGYSEAAELLQLYIENNNTTSFFKTQKDELGVLMPSLVDPSDPVLQAMLSDLQRGITSVIMHPVFISDEELPRFIFQIYVVETGNPPDYSKL